MIDEADRQPFVGWDFSWIKGRISGAPLPWDYMRSVVDQAQQSPDLLDLGTGGGEWLEHASAPFVQTVRDVGALAYGLKAISWMVPGFSIAQHCERLREIQRRIDRAGPIVVRQRRFFARARKRGRRA